MIKYTICYYTEQKEERIRVRHKKDGRVVDFNHTFEGLMNTLKRRYMETNSNYIKDNIENYMRDNFCPKCKGAGLKPEALAVTAGGKIYLSSVKCL